MIKVLMIPHRDDFKGPSGVQQVVFHWFRHLPKFDVELVDHNATSFDLKAAHAGATGRDVDVCHSHGLYWTADHQPTDPQLRTNARIVQAVRHAAQVTVPSSWVAETFQRDMHFTPHIIPHGVEWQEWQHDLPNEQYVLWNKNRVADVCNPQPVLDLAKIFAKVRFLTTFAPRNRAKPYNVTITGVMPHHQMKLTIQKAAIYLATAKETGGIGILEAMAAGVPILGYARGAILDFVDHKVNGYLAEPNNIDDLAEGLAYCWQNRDELGLAGRALAEQFSWESSAQQVANVYNLALQPELPTCCIVIPSYQYSHMVGRAIESATCQDYKLLTHIIVVDDGSDDGGATRKVVDNWSRVDHRVKYLRQPNQGVAWARNNGIASCNTKYICCLDADDSIEPNYLSTLIPSLESDRSLGIVYSGLQRIYRSNVIEARSEWPPQFNYDRQLSIGEGRGHNQIPTCCVFRRSMWQRLGGYRQRYAPTGCGTEDAEFWLRCGANGWNARRVTDKPLFIYSYLSGGTSRRTYKPADWRAWHPFVWDEQHPFASLATPLKISHPVRQYDEPEVSIVIPVGPGHQRMLIDALDSLEAQTFRKWEAVVVNDTGEPLDLTPYPYARLVDSHGPTSPGHARNFGVQHVRAPIFIPLDADDYFQPEAIQTFLTAYRDNPDRWVYSDMYILKPNGAWEEHFTEDWNGYTLWRRGICAVTALYTKEMWELVGGWDEDPTNAREDWEFHLDLVMKGYCGIKVPGMLFTYRHGTGSGEGRRREQPVKRKYTERDVEAMCKTCGKRKRIAAVMQESTGGAFELKEEPEDWPWLEYTGNSKSDLVFRGRDRRRIYRFGNNQRSRMNRVHPVDAARLLRHTYFRKVESDEADAKRGKKTKLVAQPASQVKPKPSRPRLTTRAVAPTIKEIRPNRQPKPALEPEPELEPLPFDVTKMNVVKFITIKLEDLSLSQWRNALHQEQNRERPRKMIIERCEQMIQRLEADAESE